MMEQSGKEESVDATMAIMEQISYLTDTVIREIYGNDISNHLDGEYVTSDMIRKIACQKVVEVGREMMYDETLGVKQWK